MSDPRSRVSLAATIAWRAAVVVGAGLAAVSMPACNLHQEGVRPPDNRIFFPGGATIETGGRWLYVVNSNSDLRYNSGTLVAVDLHRARQDDPRDSMGAGKEWGTCPADSRYVPRASVAPEARCCWDILDSTILNCDEQEYVQRGSTVRIGSFGGRPVMQQLPGDDAGGSGRRRMFIPVRGDTSIGMVDVQAVDGVVTFHCTGSRVPTRVPSTGPYSYGSQDTFAVCDPEWRISRQDDPVSMPSHTDSPDDTIVRLPDEPYALAVDDTLQLLYVGHLRGGNVSLIDLGPGVGLATPELVSVYGGLLPGDANGSQGITSLTIRKPGCFGAIYATSRFRPVVGSFVVYGLDPSEEASCNAPRDLDNPESNRGIAIVGTGQNLETGLAGGTETRGIEFVRVQQDAEPQTAFVLQRSPPALVAMDLATLRPFAAIEVCQAPTNLVQEVDQTGRTVSLFVTCYDAGEVYVIDPWVPRVRTIIPVGRGPITTVLPPPVLDEPGDANRGYVVGFGGNNVVVVDLDPSSANRYRVIQRLGFSSPTPREVGSQ
ncbi:MAG: hypothetical protein ABUR63_05815 [Verrucomicrobiota bacterium]